MERNKSDKPLDNTSLAREMAQKIKNAYSLKLLGQTLNITPQAVCNWQVIPPKQAIRLEKITRGQYPREKIRPDIRWHCPKCQALIDDGYFKSC